MGEPKTLHVQFVSNLRFKTAAAVTIKTKTKQKNNNKIIISTCTINCE
jgi:hypothetical protein